VIHVQRFAELGAFRNDWLNAKHHFSFGGYHDEARMGFGRLRVWNDDEVAPGTGFDPHPHREMEIVTYVRQGAITHKDSLGNEGRTEAGEVQVMHAGTGIVHAEYNKESIPTRLFQIWIMPDKRGAKPGWGMRRFPKAGAEGLAVLASGRPQDEGSQALPLNADAALLAGTVEAGKTVQVPVAKGRGVYLVPATGAITVNGTPVGTRDGVSVTDEPMVTITATETAEIVLVDVAA
jgi:redox-sensitive bicupin YhaK (pirin superfamily)